MKKKELDGLWDSEIKRLLRFNKKRLVMLLLKYKLLFFGSELYMSMKPLADYAKKTQKQLKEKKK